MCVYDVCVMCVYVFVMCVKRLMSDPYHVILFPFLWYQNYVKMKVWWKYQNQKRKQKVNNNSCRSNSCVWSWSSVSYCFPSSWVWWYGIHSLVHSCAYTLLFHTGSLCLFICLSLPPSWSPWFFTVPLISNVLGLEMFRGGGDFLAGSPQFPTLQQPSLHSFLLLPFCLPLASASQLVFLFELWKFSLCHEQASGQKARFQRDLKACLCLCLYFSGPRDNVTIH